MIKLISINIFILIQSVVIIKIYISRAWILINDVRISLVGNSSSVPDHMVHYLTLFNSMLSALIVKSKVNK